MRILALALLLVVPALAGCLGASHVPPSTTELDTDDWGVSIEGETDGVRAGDLTSLAARPVLHETTYVWYVDGVRYVGPLFSAFLPEGSYTIILEATRGDETLQTTRSLVVSPPDGPATADSGAGGAGGGTDGDDPDGGTGAGADPEEGDPDANDGVPSADAQPVEDPCVFPDEPVHVAGKDNEYTFSFPWTCQPDSWEWDLGDGTKSTSATVHHEYARDQTYPITLHILHDGQALTRTGTVAVTNVPLRIVALTDGAEAAFSLTWGRDVESVAWSFGDGTTSTDLAPTHTFADVGPWTVTADVRGADSAKGVASRELYLDAYPLTIHPEIDRDTVTFGFDWGWSADSVSWTFLHDGSISDQLAPVVQYDHPDAFGVRLEVEGEGRSAVVVSQVVITDVPVRIHVDQVKNHVTFTPVWYADLADVTWNFGDSSFGTGTVAQHDYLGYDTFEVRLQATGDGAARVSEPATVTITEIPLTIDGTLGEKNLWDAKIVWAPATSVTWDFDDGKTGSGSSTKHTFLRKDVYDVKVTATDGTHTESTTIAVDVPMGLMPDWGKPEERGVRPGIQTVTEGGGQCTAAFLLHQDASRFFLASAAHCAGESGGLGGESISTDCDDNVSLPLGTKVSFRDWRTGGTAFEGTLAYSSWLAMSEAGVTDPETCAGNDFALFEIDYADTDKVNPAVLYFGGPLQPGAAGAQPDGTQVRGYGASGTRNPGAVGDNDATNAKGGTYISYNGGWQHYVRLDDPAIPGDSGGPLLGKSGDALGVLSTIEAFPNVGANSYTDFAKALAWMTANTDLSPELVTWDEWDPTLPVPGSGDPCSSLFCEPGDLLTPGDPPGVPGLPGLPGVPPLVDCESVDLFGLVDCVIQILFGT